MAKKDNTKTVTLTTPFTRGEKAFNEISLIKPTIAALKGLKMIDVMQMDVDSYCVLLPRITSPSLTKTEILNLDPVDFTTISTEIIGFFVKPEATLEA